MSRMKSGKARAALMAAAWAASGSLALAQGGRGNTRPRARVAHHRAVQQAPIHFGDVAVSGYETVRLKLGQRADLQGPGTLVEALDPGQPGSITRLQANAITVFMVPNTYQADRVEAAGNVRFSGTRPAQGGGVQTFHGSGSKGIYLRTQRRVTLQGPVTFSSEQSVEGGKQTVSGTSGEATYDEAKQRLVLSGDVDVTVTDPGIQGPGHIQGDEVDVNLATHPYEIEIRNNQRGSKGIQFQPKQGTKKGG